MNASRDGKALSGCAGALFVGLAAWLTQPNAIGQSDSEPAGPTQRAIAYLSREVPRWHQENHCFSCHNNGDAARALYAARRLSWPVAKEALADTTQWLARPADWDNNRGDPGFSDKKLARIQFAASLAEAFEAGLIQDRAILAQAAESLAPYQEQDGSWQVDVGSQVGSPATYGTALATYLASSVIESAGIPRLRGAVERADRFLLQHRISTIPDAAAVILALGSVTSPEAAAKVKQCREFILRGQSADGGWGPYVRTPSEPFDTALALLALQSLRQRGEAVERIRRGRGYLVRTQLSEGGWPETTRPAGGRSYAQHISTSGWATLALVETGTY